MTTTPTPEGEFDMFVRAVPGAARKTRIAWQPDGPHEVQIIGRLGPYLEVFGVKDGGGHGTVFLCLDAEDAPGALPTTPIACKPLPKHVVFNPVRRRAFLRECVVATQLSHLPGFAGSFVLVVEGMPVLAMPAILPGPDGIVDLRNLLDGPPIPRAVVAFLGWSVADSLALANDTIPGLVHGDLKPENILLHRGVPLVADFGISRSTRHGLGRDALPGTPNYLAPEARNLDAELTQRTDVYAFGAMLRELVAHAVDLGPGSEQDSVASIAEHCVAEHPDDRPSGFREIADKLWESFDESVEPVASRYLLRQVLGQVTISFTALFPDGLLESLFRLEEWDLVQEVVERRPPEQRTARQWHYHGLALTRQGHDGEGLESLQLALARARHEIEVSGRALGYDGPPQPHPVFQILFDIAVLLINAGEGEDAEALGRDLLDIAETPTEERDATLVIALATARLGRLHEADDLLAALVASEVPQRESRVMMHWAEILLQRGEPSAAAARLQRAIHLTPGRAQYHRLLGEIYLFHLDEIGMAAAAFEHALRCGDVSEEVLTLWLVCTIVLAEQQPIGETRAAASRQYGAEAIDAVWESAVAMVARGRARALASAEADTAPDGRAVPDRDMVPNAEPDGAPPGLEDLGDVQIDVNDAGFFTFDFYHPHDSPAYLSLLASRYRALTTWRYATMRGTALTFLHCAGCEADITTNRPTGSAFVCKECRALNSVLPLIGERYVRLRDAVSTTLGRGEDPVEGHVCCVVTQPRIPQITDQQVEQVHELARRHGLEPVPQYHPAVLNVYVHGLSHAFFNAEYEPIGALYRFPAGGRHVVHLTPGPVEDYLVDVRRLFDVPVDSRSGRMNLTVPDVDTLIMEDRLDDAEAALAGETDAYAQRAALVLLTYLRIYRQDLVGAERTGSAALRLGGADEHAWIAKGYVDLLTGDGAGAEHCAQRAMEINGTSGSALALLGAVQHWSGADPDAVRITLRRAVALGAVFATSIN